MHRQLHLMLALAALLLLPVTPAAAGGEGPPKQYTYILKNKSHIPAQIQGDVEASSTPLCTAFATHLCRVEVIDKYNRIAVKIQKDDFTLQRKCTLDFSLGKEDRIVLVILEQDLSCSVSKPKF